MHLLYSSFEEGNSFVDSPKRMFLEFLEEKNGIPSSTKNKRPHPVESYYTSARIKGNKEAINRLRKISTSYQAGRNKSIKKSSKFSKIIQKNDRIQASSVINRGNPKMNPIRITKDLLNYLHLKREREAKKRKTSSNGRLFRGREQGENNTNMDNSFQVRYSDLLSDKPGSTLCRYKIGSAKELFSENAYTQKTGSETRNRPAWGMESGKINVKKCENADIL